MGDGAPVPRWHLLNLCLGRAPLQPWAGGRTDRAQPFAGGLTDRAQPWASGWTDRAQPSCSWPQAELRPLSGPS